jgi:hypothetical protein
MSYVCPICELHPGSHSLKKLYTRDNVEYYYTCPAKAIRYNDTVGIVAHYDGVLGEINGDWVWVFDGEGFNLEHSLCIDLAMKLVSLLSNYTERLDKIIILNTNIYVSTIYTFLYPFLSAKMKRIIEFSKDFEFHP